MKLFCFGLGYTANHLLSKLSSTSWQYSGTNTKENILFDGSRPIENIDEHLDGATHILISIPPNGQHTDSVYHFHIKNIKALKSLKWVGYLSATSVYGDLNGEWAYETTPAKPTEKRGDLRLKAENLWLNSKLPAHIFRLGGIYGPGRNQIEAVQNGRAKKIVKPGHYFSRIHVDDICDALIKSIENPAPGSIYNIVDDQPAPASDILDFICDKMKKPHLSGVTLDDADISPALRSFYKDNKKVCNKKTKKALNWQPRFQSYREGYTDLLNKFD